MTESDPIIAGMKHDSSLQGKDKSSRRIVITLAIAWLCTVGLLVGTVTKNYLDEKNKSQTLAQQVALACRNGDFGPGFSLEDEKALCANARKVIDENDPELQDKEIQEPERQDAEIQDPEIQNPEKQNAERQDAEAQNSETQEPETQQDENQDPEEQDAEVQNDEDQDPEIQDDETQDPEIQDDEIQDPEIDDPEPNDPDPNDQIQAGTCTFDGVGTLVFTFQTNTGPVTFSCTGTGTP